MGSASFPQARLDCAIFSDGIPTRSTVATCWEAATKCFMSSTAALEW